MDKVFVVMHTHLLTGEVEDIKLIGVYRTRISATQAVERAKKLMGFSEFSDGFTIDSYKLDNDNWSEGFVTITS